MLATKVLATTLGKVMEKLVPQINLKDRMLVDSVVNVNDVINLDKKSMKPCLIFKMDFEQAYDSMSWDFSG